MVIIETKHKEYKMKYRLKTISMARNEAFKTMSHEDINTKATNILKSGSNFDNATCAEFNQVMIEYHLHRLETNMAYDAALDYFDATNSGLFEFDRNINDKATFLLVNSHDFDFVNWIHSAEIGDTYCGCERIA